MVCSLFSLCLLLVVSLSLSLCNTFCLSVRESIIRFERGNVRERIEERKGLIEEWKYKGEFKAQKVQIVSA